MFLPLNLTFQAWKKRWFILRSGRMSGDPDVLEYYKNDHSKKPIRVIDLHCCEQVDAGLTFKRKEFQDSFVFDIKTSDRTFYLVAETEEEMNKWVRSICQLCGFNQSDDNHGREPCPLHAQSLCHSFSLSFSIFICFFVLFWATILNELASLKTSQMGDPTIHLL